MYDLHRGTYDKLNLFDEATPVQPEQKKQNIELKDII